MMIFTIDGIFSIVHDRYCQGDELTIRARSKKELTALSKKVTMGAVLETPSMDWPCRAIVKRSSWAGYLSHLINEIDYSSLRLVIHAITDQEDTRRESAYSGAWIAIKNAYEGTDL